MALIKHFDTITELYTILVDDFPKIIDKPMLKKKQAGKYEDISYKQFGEETEYFALGLSSIGLKRTDKVAILAESCPEWMYADMAMQGLGIIDIPLYPSLTASSVEFIVNNAEATGIIVANKFQLNKVQKIRANCRSLKYIIMLSPSDNAGGVPGLYTYQDIRQRGEYLKKEKPFFFRENLRLTKRDDICTIIYTSGTTGEPKGVVLTHNNIVSNIKGAAASLPISKEDTLLSFLPFCHIFERMTGYYTALALGCTVAFAESIEAVARNMIEIQPTVITTVPRLFERIYSKIQKNIDKQPEKKQKIFRWAIETGREYCQAKKKDDITLSLSVKHKLADKLVLKKLRDQTGGKMRFFVSGGAALPREMGEFFEAAGFIILEGYGLTETSPVIAVNRYDDYKFGTVGKLFPGVQVKIAPDGEILVRGENVMQGYYRNRRETEAVLKDGWFHTGDIGVFDAEGFLMITDRKKYLFKTSAGKYIAPTPIENLFLGSKYIDQFVLIGDRRMFLSALIVPDFEAIREYADSHQIPYQTNEELTDNMEIYDLIEKDLDQFQKQLANFEKVRKFVLLEKPFSLEAGEVTPSLKMRRKVIEERYSGLIDEMYKSLEK
jgi:long-chain acyl-CoA synthetase